MKKLIVSVLAIAGLVACMNDEVVRVQNGGAIAFENTFVQNATRANDPSTTTDNIQEFSVWAYMDAVGGVVFDDELVSRNGDAWTYNEIQYWMPGHNYYFAAFAGDRTAIETLPATMEANGLGVVKFTNVDGTNDILYSEAVVTDAAVNQDAVALTFKHLLSKVKFTFKNGFQNDNNFVVVKDITMNVAETAKVDLSADELPWTDLAGTKTLEFGHMNNAEKLAIGASKSSDNERLTIPAGADYEYTINFVVEVYNGDARGLVKDMEVKLTGLELVAGHAYNLMATINQENLNLNKIEFLVEVDEWIDQDVDCGTVRDEIRLVSTIDELQTILNEADGDLSVVLGADLTGNVIVPELAGATIAINGNGHKFDGAFQIDGKSTYANATTVFENINFVTSNPAALANGFICCGTFNGDTNKRYPDNVTIKNCTFTADETVAGIKFWSLDGNLVVENCTATGMHSLMQLTSCGKANVLVEKVTIDNCKNGISLNDSGNNVIRESNIVTREYGIRANGSVAATTIETTTIESKQPVIVRNVTTAGYILNLDADSELNTEEAYQVIFTAKSDDVAYEAPAVAFTFNGPADLVVFPNNYTVAATTDELKDAIENDNVSVVEVTEDLIYGTSDAVSIEKDLTINAEGNTISAGGASSLTPSIAVTGEYDVTLNDANIVGGFVGAYYGAYVEVNGGSLKFTDGKSGRNCFYAASTNEKASIIVINDVDVNMANASGNSYLCAHGNAIIYVNGGNFYGKPVGSSNAYVKEAAIGSYTGQVIITGGTFNFDPSEWVAAGYVATKNGSVWTVTEA